MKRKRLSIPIIYFIACIVLSAIFYFLIPSMNIISELFRLIGMMVLLVGLSIMSVALGSLIRHRTAYDFAPSTALVTDGPYRFSRNPMYVGFVLFLFGLALLSGNVIALVLPLLFFIIVNAMFIPFEEEKLGKTFGNAYIVYKQSVRRWL